MPRAIRRCTALVVAAVSGGLFAVRGLVACLPALETAPSRADAGDDSGTAGPNCGDGVIGPNEECDPSGAGTVGCTKGTNGCRVDCVGGYVDRTTNHCYFVVPGGATTYSGAVDICASRGAHLVTYASENERATIVDAGLYADAAVYWVGMCQDFLAGGYTAAAAGEPGWSATCPGCFALIPDGGQIPKLKADGGPPDASFRTDGPCIGDWRTMTAWFQMPQGVGPYNPGVLCEREPTGISAETCASGKCVVIKRTKGTKHYVFVPQEKSADDADAFCKSLPTDGGTIPGHLVILETREEREALMKEVAREMAASGTGATGVWIGLAKSDDAGTWKWDDGRSADVLPNPWGEKEPAPNVVGPARAYAGLTPERAFDTQLAHADVPTTKRPFVCQY